jgi:hypothetical protein
MVYVADPIVDVLLVVDTSGCLVLLLGHAGLREMSYRLRIRKRAKKAVRYSHGIRAYARVL